MAKRVNLLKQIATRRRLSAQRGSQLMEMALALPFLMVFMVGLSDFGGAYNVKQKLSSAAREGARLGIQNTQDLTDTPPASVVAIRNTIANHLTNAGLTGCAFGSAAPVSAGTLTWTVTPKANCVIKIERGNQSVANGSGVKLVATQVTVTYPVTWTFNKIIGFLVPGASPALPASLNSAALMQNIP